MPTLSLGSGNNTLDFSEFFKVKVDGVSQSGNFKGYLFDGGAGADVMRIHDNWSTSHFSLSTTGNGVVTLTCGSGAMTFTNFETLQFDNVTIKLGTAANDTITGSSSSDTFLYGLAGNDRIDGGLGSDKMFGGLGNDTYTVGSLSDAVTELAGEGTNDTIKSSISYSLVDTDGAGANGGNVENLTLTGTGNNYATGNALNNKITGNSGGNFITGGLGKDIMKGGAGADTFDFNAIAETSKLAAQRDIIRDFLVGTDTIDLATIDANGGAAGDTFIWLGTGAFTGVAGQLHYTKTATMTIVSGDINGDQIADFQIALTGSLTLSDLDFNL